MVLIIGIICGSIAIMVGSWRYYCMFWERNFPVNCPLGWRRMEMRFGSLLILIFTSAIAAWVGSHLIFGSPESILRWIVFFILIGILWIVSKEIGSKKAQQEYISIRKRLDENRTAGV